MPKCPVCHHAPAACECYDCHTCDRSGELDLCHDCRYAFCDEHLVVELAGKRYCETCAPPRAERAA